MAESHSMDYDCTNCGACCRSFPIFASKTDAEREHRIHTESRHIEAHLRTENEAYQLFPLPFLEKCPFLGDNQLCRIYSKRPDVCRRFSPGSSQCIEARRRQGISQPEN